MAERMLIRPESGVPGHYRWLRLDAEPRGEQHGDIEALASAALGLDAILLLPAAMVLLTEVELPVKHPGQIKQALPFALEDRLAEDVENYHLAWFRQPNRKLAVAAVAKQALSDCLAPLRQAGINPATAYPEALLLPHREGECSVAVSAGQAVFRYGAWLGGGVDAAGLPLVLEALRLEAADCRALRIYGYAGLAAWADKMNWVYSEQALDEVLPWLAGQLDAVSGFNLLTGPYAVKPVTAGESKRWLPAVGLLLLALAVQWGWQVKLNRQLRAELENLDSQTQALFRQTFPDIKRIVNVKVQAEQRLQALTKQHQAGGDEFLGMLHAAGQALSTNSGLQLRALSFADKVLRLRVSADDSARLEALLQALRNDWSVKQQIETQSTQGVEAQIELGPR